MSTAENYGTLFPTAVVGSMPRPDAVRALVLRDDPLNESERKTLDTAVVDVITVQERAGLNGRRFKMLKLRTMEHDAEADRDSLLDRNEMSGPVFKVSDDPRVTALGRWLRRWSVDEIPQLINVLLGPMSLVGFVWESLNRAAAV